MIYYLLLTAWLAFGTGMTAGMHRATKTSWESDDIWVFVVGSVLWPLTLVMGWFM